MKYTILAVALMLSGCSAWTNYIHEQAQEEFRQEIKLEKHKAHCLEIGGKWADGKGCNLDD